MSVPFPLLYCGGALSVEVRVDRQAESGGSGEVRQADGATTQRRRTVYATLDQLSLQLCLHSGLINMTAEAGSHTHTHLNTHTGRCNNVWPHLHTCYCKTCQPSVRHLLIFFTWEPASSCDRSSRIIRMTGSTTAHTVCRHIEKQRTNEAEIIWFCLGGRSKRKLAFVIKRCYSHCLNRKWCLCSRLKNNQAHKYVLCWGYTLHREQDAILISDFHSWCI